MKTCLLASGSSGNCTYIAAGETQILIDAGISLSRILRELRAIGADPQSIDGLMLSHEHGDHCRELSRVALGLGCPIYLSERTLPHVRWALTDHEEIRTFRTGESFEIGDLQIQSFRVFHDAVDPCGFLVTGLANDGSNHVRLGIATDLGTVTPPLKQLLRRCEVLILEANHDLEMLMNGSYPWDLKQRIRSPIGHLSNDAAAELVCELAQRGALQKVLLAHLSQQNNRPDLVFAAIQSRVDSLFRCEIHLSYPDQRSELVEL
jgi:phosphoribosyl 1,2-cyclic phosphodiesterase